VHGITDGTGATTDSARERWTRLAELIAATDRRGLRALNAVELDEFGRLYRRAAADLASARSRATDPRAVAYLNGLVGRAHGLIYGGRTRKRLNLREFFFAAIPRTFRASWRYSAVAFLVCALPALVAFLLATGNPAWGDALFRPGLAEVVEDFLAQEVPPGGYFQDLQGAIGADNMSGFILVNNVTVALRAFALGITAGIGTLHTLIQTGLMLGGFLGVGAHHDRLADIIGVIAPHGFLELFAIFVAGGAGLMMGWALIAPGDRPRVRALSEAARQAVTLMVGVAVMLGVAAIVEGVLSPQTAGLMQRNAPRLLLGFTVWLLAMLWLLAGDRLAGSAVRAGRDA
jgi:uncharacterized membrane protein SpoIIM required for sporulation